jgi:Protein of unknown function (DUF2997)
MPKQVRIQLFPDGRVQADLHGFKGRKCTDYIRVLEEILDARTADSDYKPEYFATEQALEIQPQQLENRGGAECG